MREAFAIAITAFLVVTSPHAEAAWGSKSEKELTKEADKFIQGKPDALKPFFHTLYMEGEWNSVLNFDLLSLAALEIGRKDIAEKALDQASLRILKIYADDPNAEKAKSLWSAEDVKDFKGEPYERAATFLYRGFLYAGAGDLENARAAFLQSEIQNAMGQTEKYPNSFSLPLLLAAWASGCIGDESRAKELLARAKGFAVEPYFKDFGDAVPKHITLVERGFGPEKVTLGEAKSILGFLPQPDLVGQVNLVYEPAQPAPASPMTGTVGNMDWLALTRGGRPIQGILDGKAAFKETASNVSGVAQAVSSAALFASLGSLGADKASVARSLAGLGAAAQLVSIFGSIAANSANAEADTRYWGSLPKTWQISAATDGPPPLLTGMVATYTKSTRPVLIKMPPSESCSFNFLRELSALDVTSGGVGNPSPWPAEPKESGRVKQNLEFRNMLMSTFN